MSAPHPAHVSLMRVETGPWLPLVQHRLAALGVEEAGDTCPRMSLPAVSLPWACPRWAYLSLGVGMLCAPGAVNVGIAHVPGPDNAARQAST